jgi:hypothetical protein
MGEWRCTYAFELAIAECPPPFLCTAMRLEFWETGNGRCGELFCSRYEAREEHGNRVLGESIIQSLKAQHRPVTMSSVQPVVPEPG